MKKTPTCKEIEEELQILKNTNSPHSVKQLIHLYENTSDAYVVLNKNWEYTHLNKNAAKLFGRTQKDLFGKNIWKEFPEGINEPFYKNYYKAIKTQTQINFIDYYKPWDKWFENRVIPFNEGLAIFFQDITESKKYEQELIKLNVAIENSLNEVSIFNAKNLKFTFANNAAIQNLGYTLEELTKMTPIDIAPKFTKEKALKILAPLKTGKVEKIQFETIRQRKDKTTYPIEAHISKFSIQGEEHFLALINDITERKKTEQALIESEDKFRSLTENTPNIILTINNKGKILYLNRVPKGLTMDKFIGESMYLFMESNFHKSVKKIVEKVFKDGKLSKYETKGIGPFGKTISYLSNIGPIFNANNEVVKAIISTQDITDRKDDEKKLKESEYLLNEAQKVAKIGYWQLDHINSSLTWSDEVFRIFNLKPQEFKPTYALFLDNIHPKDRDKVNNTYIDSLSNKKPYEITHRLLLNSNKVKYVTEKCITEFTDEGKPIRSLGTVQDITERKEIEIKLTSANQKIKESEKRFKNLFNNSPVSLWEEDISELLKILDIKLKEVDNLKQYLDDNDDFVYECASKIKILNVNNSSLDLLGVKTKEELINNLSLNFNSKSLETLKEELVILSNKETEFKRETEFVRSDGEVITVDLRMVLLGKSRVIVSMNNISDLKEAKKKAEESDRLKTEFISNMSHEIRTPMNGIMGFSEFLDDPDLGDEKRKYFVKIIKNSGKQLLQIIDDIIEISKLGTQQVKVYEDTVVLNDLLLELFSIFDAKAKENKTPLYLKKGLSDKKSTILIDSTKLNKILSNLLENALKFTNIGTIELGYKLMNSNKSPMLEIYVKDTGVGIKPEDQKLIFERFARIEKDTAKKIQGLGLGLSIAKENVLLLNGEINVESKKGKGTTFFIKIPYKPVFIENEIEGSQQKQVFLIVEDEEVNYLYISTLLVDVLKINCTILHAKNGKEAIEICETNPEIVLILMDLKMPVMSGFEASKEINKRYPTIPIVAQTAYSTKDEQRRAIEAGCSDFISKPISKETLHTIINKFVPQR